MINFYPKKFNPTRSTRLFLCLFSSPFLAERLLLSLHHVLVRHSTVFFCWRDLIWLGLQKYFQHHTVKWLVLVPRWFGQVLFFFLAHRWFLFVSLSKFCGGPGRKRRWRAGRYCSYCHINVVLLFDWLKLKTMFKTINLLIMSTINQKKGISTFSTLSNCFFLENNRESSKTVLFTTWLGGSKLGALGGRKGECFEGIAGMHQRMSSWLPR